MRPWRPSNLVARRIANALLRAYRAGFLVSEWPAWGETVCIHAITHTRLTPGTRLQLAHLWRQYGEAAWTEREAPKIQTELLDQLSLSA